MRNKVLQYCLLMGLLITSAFAQAAPDLEINTPAINAIKNSMQARFNKLAPSFNSGAIGLTKNGLVAVRDVNALPLKDRAGINSLVAEENGDRNALYKEIATGNGHPEWQGEIQSTFAQRWIDKAQAGWFYQDASGWVKK